MTRRKTELRGGGGVRGGAVRGGDAEGAAELHTGEAPWGTGARAARRGFAQRCRPSLLLDRCSLALCTRYTNNVAIVTSVRV